MFAVFNPARRTGCDHREDSAVLYPVKEFMGFLHNRQIRTEICIKHFIKADAPKSCGHLAFHICSHRISEFFTESGTHSRSGLYTDILLRIGHGVKNLVNKIFFSQSPCRTDGNTLATGYAACLTESHVKGRTNIGFKASLIGSNHADALNLFTDSHTTTAENTFAVIANHMGGRGINFAFKHLAVIFMFIGHAQIPAELLQFTVSASNAGKTFLPVIGQKKLKCFFPRF